MGKQTAQAKKVYYMFEKVYYMFAVENIFVLTKLHPNKRASENETVVQTREFT